MIDATDRQIGDTFTADGLRWTVYRIDPDGTVCSRYAGCAGKAGRTSEASVDPSLDDNRTCSFRTNHTYHRFTQCDKPVLRGTTLCRAHQWAKRYAVID